jgi:hypothetical protein
VLTHLHAPTCQHTHAHADDPFRGLLSCSTAADSSRSSSTPKAAPDGDGISSSRFLLPPDPLTDASASLAAAFSRQDVANLLAVLANKVSPGAAVHQLLVTLAGCHLQQGTRLLDRSELWWTFIALCGPYSMQTCLWMQCAASYMTRWHDAPASSPVYVFSTVVQLRSIAPVVAWCPPLQPPQKKPRVWRRSCAGQLLRSCWP